jgi:hypothetical protein
MKRADRDRPSLAHPPAAAVQHLQARRSIDFDLLLSATNERVLTLIVISRPFGSRLFFIRVVTGLSVHFFRFLATTLSLLSRPLRALLSFRQLEANGPSHYPSIRDRDRVYHRIDCRPNLMISRVGCWFVVCKCIKSCIKIF